MVGLMVRSSVLMIIIFLVQVQSKDKKIIKMAKDIERNCGLKGDDELWSYCIEDEKEFDLNFNREHIRTGRFCSNNTINDYRCYKACQYEKLGVLDPKTGQIYPDKYFIHLNNLFEGHLKTVVEKIKNNSKGCFVVNGKNVTMSLTKCEQNESTIQCLLDRYKEICRPSDDVVVPKQWRKTGRKCKIYIDTDDE